VPRVRNDEPEGISVKKLAMGSYTTIVYTLVGLLKTVWEKCDILAKIH
jgi:hypothetical protein